MYRPDHVAATVKTGTPTLRQYVGDHVNTEVTYDEVTHADRLVMPSTSENNQGIVAVIPAHNEGGAIIKCLQSIVDGTLWPELTLVVANNCSKGDTTVEDVLRFQETYPDFPLALHNVEGLVGRKTGALCYAWSVLEDLDYDWFISMDGDVILDRECLHHLYDEISSGDKIGGVSARYNFLPEDAKGPIDRVLLYYQRIDFTMWTMGLLKKPNRETYVLGGQVSIMSREAMEQISDSRGDEGFPWSSETAVEDMELTWRMNDHGYSTRCSADARAWVGHMPSRAALWGQRTKWDRGIVDLLRDPKMHSSNGAYMKEPKRQQWRSFTDLILRVLLYTALPLALLYGSYELFGGWWMPILAGLPILLSLIIGVQSALNTPKRRLWELIASAIYFPLEFYVWFRTILWARAWIGSLRGEKQDLWAAQAAGEGKAMEGSSARQPHTVTSHHGRHRAAGLPAMGPRYANDRDDSTVLRAGQPQTRAAIKADRTRRGEAPAQSKPRGNKGYFRWTLLAIFATLTLVMFLGTFLSNAFWLGVVMNGSVLLLVAVSLAFTLLGDAFKKRGKKAPGSRWLWLLLLVAIILLAIFGRELVLLALAWLKYVVALAGTPVRIYLYFAWYILAVITVIMCIILIIKIVQNAKIRRKGLRP